jgi:ribosomal protein L18E
MKKIQKLTQPLRNNVFKRLEAPRRNYEKTMINNMDNLCRVIRKGDVILVEGNSEISRMIKYKTLWAQTIFENRDSKVEQTTERKDPDREPIPAQ